MWAKAGTTGAYGAPVLKVAVGAQMPAQNRNARFCSATVAKATLEHYFKDVLVKEGMQIFQCFDVHIWAEGDLIGGQFHFLVGCLVGCDHLSGGERHLREVIESVQTLDECFISGVGEWPFHSLADQCLQNLFQNLVVCDLVVCDLVVCGGHLHNLNVAVVQLRPQGTALRIQVVYGTWTITGVASEIAAAQAHGAEGINS